MKLAQHYRRPVAGFITAAAQAIDREKRASLRVSILTQTQARVIVAAFMRSYAEPCFAAIEVTGHHTFGQHLAEALFDTGPGWHADLALPDTVARALHRAADDFGRPEVYTRGTLLRFYRGSTGIDSNLFEARSVLRSRQLLTGNMHRARRKF